MYDYIENLLLAPIDQIKYVIGVPIQIIFVFIIQMKILIIIVLKILKYYVQVAIQDYTSFEAPLGISEKNGTEIIFIVKKLKIKYLNHVKEERLGTNEKCD